MVDRHDYVALEWVKGEIANTLKQARAALDGYVLHPMPETLAQCLECVHQVHGSLLMVEFYGAALLAEEMEHLVIALQQGRVSQLDETLRLLQQAFNQLPLYLDRVHSARRDWPLVVLPLINDLRTARGEALLSETSLFSPPLLTLPELDDGVLAQLTPADLPQQLRTARHELQSALLGLLREQDVRTNLELLANVFERLKGLCKGAPLNSLWQICAALIEGMLKGEVANSPALRSLLKESDKELKRLLEQGIQGINQPAPDELLRSLLFYIAKAERPTPKMLALKNRYELDEAMPDAAMVDQERARLAGPDRDAMRSVVAALCEELVRVKERLDLFVRSDRLHVSELSNLMAPLRQIADTLAVLGFGQPRKVIIDQLAVVQSIAQGQREPTDAVLMDVAAALLYVESTLAGMVGNVEPSLHEESRLPTTDLMQIHQLVIKEARIGLEEAKELMGDYLAADRDRQHLQLLPGLLTQIRGALAMIPLSRAASLLQACNDYISEHLLGPHSPSAVQLEHLADALISIEYYLERLAQDPGAAGEAVLDRAEESLIELGYAPMERNVPLLDDVLSPNEILVMQDLQELGDPQVMQSLADVLASPLSALNPPAQYIPESLLAPPVDEEPVDDELLEVFLEETDEVLVALHDYLPQWVANPEDSAALAELRRGFHTLKGSGRMVRALVLGELAWAIENLLNRVIERSVAASPTVQQLLDDVLNVLPELIQEFAERNQRQREDVDQLAARAHQLSKGEPQPLLIEQDSASFDPQLLDIFRQEAQTHLESLNRFLGRASEQLPLHASDQLQLAVHTLKGSAHMAGVLRMAELASPLDYLVREYKAHHIALDLDEVELLLEADSLLHRGLKQLDLDPLAEIYGARSLIERTERLVAARLETVLNAPATGLKPTRDPQRIAEFLSQGMDILFDAEDLLRHWRQHPYERDGLDTLLDQLTLLGESAHLADLQPIDELCEALLDVYGAVEESSLTVSERFFHEADSANEALISMLDQLAAGQEITPRPDQVQTLRALLHEGLAPDATGLIRREGEHTLGISELSAATAALSVNEQADEHFDNDIAAIFVEEAVDILDNTGQALQRWLQEPDSLAPLSSLQRDLHTLKGGARMAGIGPIGDLAHELEHLYEGLLDRRFSYSPALTQLLARSHAQLTLLLEQLQQHQPLSEPQALLQAIQAFRLHDSPAGEQRPPEPPTPAGADAELLDIFLEEAFEIIESSGAALLRWQVEPHNPLELENLLRDLHTLKGGARMVEIAPIGDLAHELENLCEDLSAGLIAPNAPLFAVLQSSYDCLAQMLDALRSGEPVPSAEQLIAQIRAVERGLPQAVAAPTPTKPEPITGPLNEIDRTGLDTVKVPAELLEDLVNLAGETSIIRGRIEQQSNDGQVALNEMQTTLERMRDQLRRLDSETEGSLGSRPCIEADGVAYDEFDPLEMDRHSQLQQLSRALFESVSDLLDLKATLVSRNQDTQGLLQKQARINTRLQEGLMGTRMVPFERVLPRLKRIVRQVASELGKQVEFNVINAQGEIDRNVLERMVAPLEHMLRNAVDHGLEPADVRHANGKAEQGLITLELSHEGGDVVFNMRDDGAGIPLEAVRRKAIHRGLLDPHNTVSDRDVLQFILQPGFSTAEKITQISGRGVGMDVVHEEVRQLGGSMTIDSVPGQGVHFQIRLPFSVSLNRALMVQCADEQYAIALNTVEGIVRVMPNELEGYYQLNPPLYHYGGQTYELRYLGELLQTVGKPKLAGEKHSLPVLLVHCQDQRVALQVDALAGSREIVVKSLGPQFAGVQGLSGATILGDGRVVLILDLLAYIRAHQARLPLQRAIHEGSGTLEFTPAIRPPLVLVVDDSVTVRKVTSRLLERNGMNVITAKDGVDAMSVLEEHTPDLMLLDIEMPRMDGFEVATQVRNDPRLKDIPIIMITSRTGQKHQNRAMAIGVNDYLGKPYQESVLLERIAYWSNFHA